MDMNNIGYGGEARSGDEGQWPIVQWEPLPLLSDDFRMDEVFRRAVMDAMNRVQMPSYILHMEGNYASSFVGRVITKSPDCAASDLASDAEEKAEEVQC